MVSDVQERCLPPKGSVVNGRGAAYCQRIASLSTGPGVGFGEGPKSFKHAK
jgi:hypothetical protein